MTSPSTLFDLFAKPVVDPSQVSATGGIGKSAPSKNQAARECSRDGAIAAGPRMADQQQRLLGAYRVMGPQTDQEMADFLGLDRSTVIPRRTELMDLGLVIEDGKAKNPRTGIRNTRYRLTTT